jgi:acetylornithine deacetylase/succinyl-diaminopimelate desuccinylase-like protein
MAHDDPTAEVTEVLQAFIRNACVNDGTADSGEEVRSADLVTNYLEGSGLDLEYYEPHAGRRSVLAKIEGSDPTAPGLMLMGHTDVVPVNPDTWSRDPFGGELVDGVVWGRGAVDMLNLTASMLVAFRRLADSGFRPRGTLSYLAVADEEASGTYGAEWLLEHELDALRTENVITESGGFQMGSRGGVRLPVMVEEKGAMWSKLTVKGTPGHGSQPHRTDNAVLKAAQIVQRIRRGHAAAGRARRPGDARRRDRGPPDRGESALPLVHAHHDVAQRLQRRHEGEHDPGPRGRGGGHPHAAGGLGRRRRGDARRRVR